MQSTNIDMDKLRDIKPGFLSNKPIVQFMVTSDPLMFKTLPQFAHAFRAQFMVTGDPLKFKTLPNTLLFHLKYNVKRKCFFFNLNLWGLAYLTQKIISKRIMPWAVYLISIESHEVDI